MTASKARVAALCAVGTAVCGALLFGPSACDGCGTVTSRVWFDNVDYYTWAWERSGGTLAIAGVVPAAASQIPTIIAGKPGASCPPPPDVVPYAREALRPENTRATYRNIRPGSDKERDGKGADCLYDYDQDYCPNDP